MGDLNSLGLNTIIHSTNQKLKANTDIYLVDSYGVSSRFYNLSNVTFMGGSLIKHGGQNPLEPARMGNFIISGPNINNFREIYSFLFKNKISLTVSNISKMNQIIIKKINQKNDKKIIKKIRKIGNHILNKNLFYINQYLK